MTWGSRVGAGRERGDVFFSCFMAAYTNQHLFGIFEKDSIFRHFILNCYFNICVEVKTYSLLESTNLCCTSFAQISFTHIDFVRKVFFTVIFDFFFKLATCCGRNLLVSNILVFSHSSAVLYCIRGINKLKKKT